MLIFGSYVEPVTPREAVAVPYLDTEEICQDVEFEECVDAEVQVK